jgi:asparagine synthase (glutamine-hydrolysing)
MCGIAGLLLTEPPEDREVLTAMRDAMRHRGPDDAGAWWSDDGRVGLAQRRLAIIDLSPGGHQPMQDASGDLCITFNGEIYNYLDLRRELESLGHAFRTASDTEVILEAWREWGEGALARLNGMFAFGLWDRRARRLVLARDRAGEKPLFYWRGPRGLAFASELKALIAIPDFPRVLDLDALPSYLAFGYVPFGRCLLRGVRKLEPAHAIAFEPGREPRTWAWWTLPDPPTCPPPGADALEAELESLLEDAVRRQLVADVPVGILLSGGIDSSLVTAMAARSSRRPVKTFTIAFPGHGVHDESGFARIVASHFGTEHTELAAEPATVELLPELARQYDEPIADSSMVPTFLVSRLVRRHATVALGGDGGDELFGGYDQHLSAPRQQRIRRFLPRPLRRAAGAFAERALSPGFRGRSFVVGFMADAADSLARTNIYFDGTARRRLLSAAVSARGAGAAVPEEEKARLYDPGASVLQNATRMDFRTYLPDDILVKVDRASMLNSLEVRAPFLDHRIVELAYGRIPDALRAAGATRKVLLKRLAARVLPRELELERKQGFSIPLDAWLRGTWGAWFGSVLENASPELFRPEEIRSLLARQRAGTSNAARLFALTMFELWRREYRIGVA